MIALGLALSAHAAMVDRIAAVVEDEPIALSELYDLGGTYIAQACPGQETGACVLAAELEVLDAVVERVLVRQSLEKLDLDVTGAEVDRGIDAMVEQYQVADRMALRAGFEEQGVAWETVREQVADEIRMLKFQENVIRPRIAVSENDIEDLYQRMVRDSDTAKQLELEAFSVAMPEGDAGAAKIAELAAVVAALNAGTREWAATVAELNDGKVVRDGKMGAFELKDLARPLQAALLGVATGRVTDPVVVGPEILVIKIMGEKSVGVKSLDEVRDQLLGQLYQQKGEAEMTVWYAQAKRGATIRVLLTSE